MAAKAYAIELQTQIRALGTGGPGNTQDTLVLTDSYGVTIDWYYLNNSKTAPTTGLIQGAVAFAKPAFGSYIVKFVGPPPTSTVLSSDIIDIKPEPLAVLEFELLGKGGGWAINRDWVRSPGVSWHRGLPGTDTMDLVADIGTMSLTLDNSEKNSKKLVGLYSPDHANRMYGFAINIGARLRIGSNVRFTGIISAIDPIPGKWGPRTVSVEMTDWMSVADRTRISNLPVLINKRGDEVFQALIDALPAAAKPDFVQTDISPDTYPYTLDRTRDEATVLRDELYRLASSGLALIYVRGDGTLIHESRNYRAGLVVSDVDTFIDSHGFSATHDRNAIINRAQSTIHPRLPSTADVVMYSLPQPMALVAGLPVTILGGWTDPANPATRVGAVSLATLVSGTDYAANTLANGTGTDLTAGLTVTTGVSGNATLFTITCDTNGFLTILKQRGKPLYDYGSVVLTWDDAASIEQFGLADVNIDMPYTANAALALEVAQFTVYKGAFPTTNISGFTRMVDINNAIERDRSINRNISDRIRLTDGVTGISRSFFINAIEETLDEGVITTQWLLMPADTSAYWELEVTGKSELDLTTRLGFGQILGHTDIPHQNTHDDITHVDVTHEDSHTDNQHQDVQHGDGQGVHGDTIHSDVPFANTAHNDRAFANSFGNEAHEDVPFSNSHSDIQHGDQPHQNAHSNHSDVTAGQAFSDHWDCVDAVSFYHGDSGHPTLFYHHMDCRKTPSNSEHSNFAYINEIAQSEYHNNVSDHTDVSFSDQHSNSHADAFVNNAHSNTHNDVQHVDRTHVDAHDDVTHIDVDHGDTAFANVAHADAIGHADSPHSNTAHGDVTHQDVSHGDVKHADHHDDYHGDTN
jgi:hypothetical protein